MSEHFTDESGQLAYYPDTGLFVWRISKRGLRPGTVAGGHDRHGYIRICLNYKGILAHRLAWKIMTGEWPEQEIDHINTVRDDNRWSNLRVATSSQNKRNTKLRKDNSTGFKGVSVAPLKGGYKATIGRDRKQHHLGYFPTPEEAHAAYVAAAHSIEPEFSRTTYPLSKVSKQYQSAKARKEK